MGKAKNMPAVFFDKPTKKSSLFSGNK